LANSFDVLFLDMFRYRDPEHEQLVKGFPSLEAAIESGFAESHTQIEMRLGIAGPNGEDFAVTGNGVVQPPKPR
jgi:hypothetical protein